MLLLGGSRGVLHEGLVEVGCVRCDISDDQVSAPTETVSSIQFVERVPMREPPELFSSVAFIPASLGTILEPWVEEQAKLDETESLQELVKTESPLELVENESQLEQVGTKSPLELVEHYYSVYGLSRALLLRFWTD
ncbi:hypothetical protein BHM03_00032754 [Ensete ventricosum]|nr:hypothetical protein BHM03_00032754 [Ensete ventricosum]